MNDFEQAEVRLRELAKLSVEEQAERRGEIIGAFEIFWRSNPKRQQFGEVCFGLVITPEILWTMAKVG